MNAFYVYAPIMVLLMQLFSSFLLFLRGIQSKFFIKVSFINKSINPIHASYTREGREGKGESYLEVVKVQRTTTSRYDCYYGVHQVDLIMTIAQYNCRHVGFLKARAPLDKFEN